MPLLALDSLDKATWPAHSPDLMKYEFFLRYLHMRLKLTLMSTSLKNLQLLLQLFMKHQASLKEYVNPLKDTTRPVGGGITSARECKTKKSKQKHRKIMHLSMNNQKRKTDTLI